jgi:hypothetical protein
MIQGIWLDEAEKFHPEQWVNVYEVSAVGVIYSCSCQVADLNKLSEGFWEYGLEPTDENGNPISVKAAIARKNSLLTGHVPGGMQ